jgi:hypothetical protein
VHVEHLHSGELVEHRPWGEARSEGCPRGLPRYAGGSASATSLSTPAQAVTHVTARQVARPPKSGLRHEASIQPVAQPNRSSATRPIDHYLGGFFLHWLSVPFRGTLHDPG